MKHRWNRFIAHRLTGCGVNSFNTSHYWPPSHFLPLPPTQESLSIDSDRHSPPPSDHRGGHNRRKSKASSPRPRVAIQLHYMRWHISGPCRPFSYIQGIYKGENIGLYVVARNFFLLLLNCSAWPYLGPAQQNKQTFIYLSVMAMACN